MERRVSCGKEGELWNGGELWKADLAHAVVGRNRLKLEEVAEEGAEAPERREQLDARVHEARVAQVGEPCPARARHVPFRAGRADGQLQQLVGVRLLGGLDGVQLRAQLVELGVRYEVVGHVVVAGVCERAVSTAGSAEARTQQGGRDTRAARHDREIETRLRTAVTVLRDHVKHNRSRASGMAHVVHERVPAAQLRMHCIPRAAGEAAFQAHPNAVGRVADVAPPGGEIGHALREGMVRLGEAFAEGRRAQVRARRAIVG